MEQQTQINVQGVIETLSQRIAQLEVDKAILIEQVKAAQVDTSEGE